MGCLGPTHELVRSAFPCAAIVTEGLAVRPAEMQFPADAVPEFASHGKD